MAISARFLADFSDFNSAVDKADLKLKSFESDANKVEKSLAKIGNSLSGQKVIQDAALMASAVEKIGGVSKLTERELAKVGDEAREAIAKMRALGIEVPQNLQKIADAAKPAAAGISGIGDASKPAASGIASVVGSLKNIASVVGLGFGVGAVVNFAKSVFDTSSEINNLSQSVGLSTQEFQRFSYVGVGAGLEMDEMAAAAGNLNKRLASGDSGAVSAVQSLGLSVKELVASGPKEAFLSIAEAANRISDPMTKNAIVADLFGDKVGRRLIPLLGDLRNAIESVPQDAIISDEDIKKADELGNKFDQLVIKAKAWTAWLLLNKGNDLGKDLGFEGKQDTFLEVAADGFVTRTSKANDIDLSPFVGPTMDAAISNVDLLKNRLASLRAQALDPLTASQKAAIKELDSYGVSNKEIADLLGTNEIAVKRYTDALREQEQQAKKTEQELKKLHDEIKKLEDVNVGEVTRFGLDDPEIQALRDRLDIMKKVAAVEPDARAAGAALYGITQALHGIGDGTGELDKVREHLKAVENEGHLLVDIFQEIPSLMRDAATGGGGFAGAMQGLASHVGASLFGENGPLGFFAGGAMNKFGGTLTKVFGDAFGFALPGIGQAFGALLGPLVGKLFSIGGPSKEELEGRDLVADFERELESKLSLKDMRDTVGDEWKRTIIAVKDALGDEAKALKLVERLWASSKEGPEAVERAILDIKLAMEEAASAQKAVNEETEKAGPAMSAAAEAAKAVLDDLMKQRESLANSVANEAPEEVMGVIEAQTLGQMAALDEAIRAQQEKLDEEARNAKETIENELNKIKPDLVTIEYEYRLHGLPPWVRDFPGSGELPEPIPQATGGDWLVRKPTLFLAGEAGPERATFTPLGRQPHQANQSMVEPPSGDVVLTVDGAVLGRIARRDILRGGDSMREFRDMLRVAAA